MKTPRHKHTADDVADAVCAACRELLGVSIWRSQLVSEQSRVSSVVLARRCVVAALRNWCAMTWTGIGAYTGRSHSTLCADRLGRGDKDAEKIERVLDRARAMLDAKEASL